MLILFKLTNDQEFFVSTNELEFIDAVQRGDTEYVIENIGNVFDKQIFNKSFIIAVYNENIPIAQHLMSWVTQDVYELAFKKAVYHDKKISIKYLYSYINSEKILKETINWDRSSPGYSLFLDLKNGNILNQDENDLKDISRIRLASTLSINLAILSWVLSAFSTVKHDGHAVALTLFLLLSLLSFLLIYLSLREEECYYNLKHPIDASQEKNIISVYRDEFPMVSKSEINLRVQNYNKNHYNNLNPEIETARRLNLHLKNVYADLSLAISFTNFAFSLIYIYVVYI